MKMKGGGGTESSGVVLTRELEVLAILKGVHNIFTISKFYSVLKGEGKGFTLYSPAMSIGVTELIPSLLPSDVCRRPWIVSYQFDPRELLKRKAAGSKELK